MAFNEDSPVKIPTILHLMRLDYTYLSLSNQKWDESTNIFTDVFNENIKRLNPPISSADIDRTYSEVALCLENEDFGKVFYEIQELSSLRNWLLRILINGQVTVK